MPTSDTWALRQISSLFRLSATLIQEIGGAPRSAVLSAGEAIVNPPGVLRDGPHVAVQDAAVRVGDMRHVQIVVAIANLRDVHGGGVK